MDQSAPASARPVVIGDILSFDTQPDRDEDIMECTVNWKQDGNDRSDKYMVFKAKNVTAGDTNSLVPVFVQTSYYDKDFGNARGVVEFTITDAWQFGQRDETGADRFVILHNQDNKPYQHRFVAGWLTKLATTAHGAASAAGYARYADSIDALGKSYLGDYLHPYAPLIVESGDVLLVPSKLPWFSFGNKKTITWRQNLSQRTAEYYSFTVVNTTQSLSFCFLMFSVEFTQYFAEGQDVVFFIQKELWDSDSTADNHISKIATKNANGYYELKMDVKSQYGQVDKTGKGRWVVYHDKGRTPFQHRFVKSLVHNTVESAVQAQAVAGYLGIKVGGGVDFKEIVKLAEDTFGDYLHTFN
ncbi:unnamed protein product [Rhizoctonia solani]|uniref:Uncharacterized protein n=3 Tax=Rhizoctonia solani TaxID=456999 RepID=A0A8H3C2K3_9AGAM|nr:hypothetical protein RSOL_367590 [Rhizoctonia solani AG-3 Rhs1AP]KEP49986.1 hypothetical protein V565_089090 [Rhizoctonia solani 123E]CAE6458129.1 unnamed protein product [Rhizoctonia solani]CAE6470153.1 unnamed protein product [Rhizoctonia solani]